MFFQSATLRSQFSLLTLKSACSLRQEYERMLRKSNLSDEKKEEERNNDKDAFHSEMNCEMLLSFLLSFLSAFLPSLNWKISKYQQNIYIYIQTLNFQSITSWLKFIMRSHSNNANGGSRVDLCCVEWWIFKYVNAIHWSIARACNQSSLFI